MSDCSKSSYKGVYFDYNLLQDNNIAKMEASDDGSDIDFED